MSTEDTTVSFSLEVNVEKAYEDIRKLEMLLYRIIGLFRRLGMPEDVEQAIIKVQKAIAILNMYRLTVAAAQAAAGPIGWALLGISVAQAMVSTAELGDMIEDELRGS